MMRRIAVLMGGESQEREVSRVSGTEVAKALAARGHDVTLLDTAHGAIALTSGETPKIGREPPKRSAASASATAPSGAASGAAASASATAVVATGRAGLPVLAGSLSDVDCVFLALHGGWGEDGTVQALFELAGIPFTGSGVLGSALAMDKDRAKRVFQASGVPTPDWTVFDLRRGDPSDAELASAAATLGPVLVVKPNAEGSTVGLSVVREGGDLRAAVRTAAEFGSRVLVERYIDGRELTVAILGDEALPVVEIVPEGGVYTYEAKYTSGRSRYVAPADLPEETARAVRRSAKLAFDVLGCEGFARVDYRLPPDGDFRCLEVNTIPGMTPLSLVPMAAKSAGISFGELLERIVEQAIRRGGSRRS
jgi:D-alanine-D-alanine ligase